VSNSTDELRTEVIGRLRKSRELYEKCVADVSAELAYSGSEWSITDLLLHSTGSYVSMLSRILEEDNPDLGGGYDAEAAWQRVVGGILSSIDNAISSAELPLDKLERSGRQVSGSIRVLDVIVLMANHFEEHLAQLKDEVRPREGLPNI